MAQIDMLSVARAEVLRLEEELSKTELGKKLALARQVVSLYQQNEPPPPIPIHGEFTAIDMRLQAAQVANDLRSLMEDGLRTKTAKIEKVCADYLRAKRKRATSGELAEVVIKSGIHLSGVMPSKSLAAVLSNSKLFDNIREEGGYGLLEWSHDRLEAMKRKLSQLNEEPAADKSTAGS